MNGRRGIKTTVKQTRAVVEIKMNAISSLGANICRVGGALETAGYGALDNTSSMKSFWLVKSEPSTYSWQDFVAERETSWTGVRNYTARNNLRKMRKGDEVFFYHSGEDKAVVGIAKVTRPAYPDTTAKGRRLERRRSCASQSPAPAGHAARDQTESAT